MSFRDMVAADLHGVFLNTGEFADVRTVRYDGNTYPNVSVVLNGLKEQDRTQLMSDHAQGLYYVSDILHCAVDDIGGVLPEKGMKFEISDGQHFRRFFIASSQLTAGMVRLELEAIDE